jgi:hypothetical protein
MDGFVESKARIDVVLLNADRTIGFDLFLATPEETEMVKLARSSYGFCLNDGSFELPARITLNVFADKIEDVFDCQSNIVNRMTVTALRSVHKKMERAVSQGVVFRCSV